MIMIIILVMPLYKIHIKWHFDLFLSGEGMQESQLGKSYCSSLNGMRHVPFPQNRWFSLIPSPKLRSREGNTNHFSEERDAPCHAACGLCYGAFLIIPLYR